MRNWDGFEYESDKDIVHFTREDEDDNIVEIESYERPMNCGTHEEMLARYFEATDFWLATQYETDGQFAARFAAA